MNRLTDVPQAATALPPTTLVAPSGTVGLVLRALVAVGLVAGWVQLAHTPVHRPLEELVWHLQTGQVTSLTIERPPPDSSGQFTVEWDGPGRPSVSTYHHNTGEVGVVWHPDVVDDSGDPEAAAARIDERAEIVALAQRSGVEVRERGWEPSTVGVGWLVGFAWLAGLFLLVSGPPPRLATRWAWFWLVFHAPLAMLALVILEPTPWGRRRPVSATTRRLTGGWAFLLSILLVAVLSAVPWYSELFPT